jgi:hypothetical protein
LVTDTSAASLPTPVRAVEESLLVSPSFWSASTVAVFWIGVAPL